MLRGDPVQLSCSTTWTMIPRHVCVLVHRRARCHGHETAAHQAARNKNLISFNSLSLGLFLVWQLTECSQDDSSCNDRHCRLCRTVSDRFGVSNTRRGCQGFSNAQAAFSQPSSLTVSQHHVPDNSMDYLPRLQAKPSQRLCAGSPMYTCHSMCHQLAICVLWFDHPCGGSLTRGASPTKDIRSHACAGRQTTRCSAQGATTTAA
jgi:hypothetical protein